MNAVVHWRRRATMLVCGVAVSLAMAVALQSPSVAEAGTSPYCNNQNLGGWGWCAGAKRTLYATYGWGDQHSVCVYASQSEGGGGTTYKCSGGSGQGVYNPAGVTAYLYPKISNNAGGSNTVHGVAFQP